MKDRFLQEYVVESRAGSFDVLLVLSTAPAGPLGWYPDPERSKRRVVRCGESIRPLEVQRVATRGCATSTGKQPRRASERAERDDGERGKKTDSGERLKPEIEASKVLERVSDAGVCH